MGIGLNRHHFHKRSINLNETKDSIYNSNDYFQLLLQLLLIKIKLVYKRILKASSTILICMNKYLLTWIIKFFCD